MLQYQSRGSCHLIAILYPTVPKLSVFRGILNKYMIRIAAELIVCMKLYEMISTADPNVQYSSGCGLACQVIYQPDINHHFQLTWL